ncbi:unnamed protein product [Gadus morhua 'NCC']
MKQHSNWWWCASQQHLDYSSAISQIPNTWERHCCHQGIPYCGVIFWHLQTTFGKGYHPSEVPPSRNLQPDQKSSTMDSMKSLGAPFASCVYWANPGKKTPSVRRNSFTRRKSIGARRMSLPGKGIGRRKSLPCRPSQKVPESWLTVYQADLQKERKRQQAVLAKKNAERSIGKTHFRSQHCLPRKPSNPARKPASKRNQKSLFGAFQGLSLDGAMGGGRGAAARASAGGDPCKVM